MIVVTGGTGHIGNVLVRELLSRGEKVRVVIPSFEDDTPIKNLDVEKAEGDVLNYPSIVRAFRDAECVYHLAGIVSITSGRKQRLYDVNINGTKNVVRACMEAGVKRLVYTSSVHAFVEPPHGIALQETAEINPSKVVGDYAKTKAKATIEVKKAVESGLNAVIVHPSGVIGPYEYKISNTGQMIVDYVNRKLPGCIEGAYDFVDVRDTANGLILACEKGLMGESYIISGQQVTVKELYIMLQSITGIKAPLFKVPSWMALIISPFMQVYSLITGNKPIITPYSIRTLSSNSLISHDKASTVLGYNPRPIIETIRDTVNWLEKSGKIVLNL